MTPTLLTDKQSTGEAFAQFYSNQYDFNLAKLVPLLYFYYSKQFNSQCGKLPSWHLRDRCSGVSIPDIHFPAHLFLCCQLILHVLCNRIILRTTHSFLRNLL